MFFCRCIMTEFDTTTDIDAARNAFLPVDAAIVREASFQIEAMI